jgi:phosphotransferase system HPr (HPr) family protein
VKEVVAYAGEVRVEANGGTCDLRSIIGLLALELVQGSRVVVRVKGPDEASFCRRLVTLFETRFDFPPRAEGQTTEQLVRGAED